MHWLNLFKRDCEKQEPKKTYIPLVDLFAGSNAPYWTVVVAKLRIRRQNYLSMCERKSVQLVSSKHWENTRRSSGVGIIKLSGSLMSLKNLKKWKKCLKVKKVGGGVLSTELAYKLVT